MFIIPAISTIASPAAPAYFLTGDGLRVIQTKHRYGTVYLI